MSDKRANKAIRKAIKATRVANSPEQSLRAKKELAQAFRDRDQSRG